MKKPKFLKSKKNNSLVAFEDNQEIKNIIFDLDGVLFVTNPINSVVGEVIPKVIKMIIKDRKLPSKKYFYEQLLNLPGTSSHKSYNNGLLIPPVLIDWLTGIRCRHEIKEQITTYINKYISSSFERSVLFHVVDVIFDPHKLIETRKPLDEMVQKMKFYKDRNYKLFVLSNWDKDSFELLQKKYDDVFSNFTDVLISGGVGVLKPSIQFFEKAIEQFAINPKESLFIDDERANIESAKLLNFHTHWFLR